MLVLQLTLNESQVVSQNHLRMILKGGMRAAKANISLTCKKNFDHSVVSRYLFDCVVNGNIVQISITKM